MIQVEEFPIVTRLAPSPTGYLHLGNAWAFLLAWLAARNANGKVILRMEDIDPQRSRAIFAESIIQDLYWLGLDWDEGPDVGGNHAPYVQSQCLALYAEALSKLEQQHATYPCFCSRKDLRSLSSAPQIGDMGVAYPGTCRRLSAHERKTLLEAGRKAATRFACPEEPVHFVDLCAGPQSHSLQSCGGDFALCRSDGIIAYQLAVVVDDARMGITHVIRGRDILPSTPRQVILQKYLGLPVPLYVHVPLLLDGERERLAKRHQSLSLASLRERGINPNAIIGLLGKYAGIHPDGTPISAALLAKRFNSFEDLPKEDIVVAEFELSALH